MPSGSAATALEKRMKPAPLADLAVWQQLIRDSQIARHGEKAKAAERLKQGVREILRAEVAA